MRILVAGGAGYIGSVVTAALLAEDRDLVALGQERGRDYAADVAGSTGDEYAHGVTLGREVGTSW